MGIKRLLNFLKEAIDEIHIQEYSGQRVAIDTYCWIHKGCFSCADKLAKGEKTDLYVKYCMKFINLLLQYNITPVLVFDGCNLEAKNEVELERRQRRKENLAEGKRLLRQGKFSAARDCFTRCVNVTSKLALDVMDAARAKGIDCIVAPYEADAQLAYLLKHKLVEAIITEDSDLLCFGCHTVIFKLDLSGRCQRVCESNFGRVGNLEGFTQSQFRQMCILSGCDYLPNIKNVGIMKACRALKQSKGKNGYAVARGLHQYVKGIDPVEPEYVKGFECAEKTFLYQLVFDPVNRKLVPLNPYPEGLTAEEMPFAGKLIPTEVAFQISIGNIDISTLKPISNFDVDAWLQTLKTSSRVGSIWKTEKTDVDDVKVSEGGFKLQGKVTRSSKNISDHFIQKTPSKKVDSEKALKLFRELENRLEENTEDIPSTIEETPPAAQESPSVVEKVASINIKPSKQSVKSPVVVVKSRFFMKTATKDEEADNQVDVYKDSNIHQSDSIGRCENIESDIIVDYNKVKKTNKRKSDDVNHMSEKKRKTRSGLFTELDKSSTDPLIDCTNSDHSFDSDSNLSNSKQSEQNLLPNDSNKSDSKTKMNSDTEIEVPFEKSQSKVTADVGSSHVKVEDMNLKTEEEKIKCPKKKVNNPFKKVRSNLKEKKGKILKLFKEKEDEENSSVDSVKTPSAISSSKKRITKPKFLGKAKASGLRKRKNSSFQSSIKTFFDKV